jgi:peptide subunit release factor RF-3
VGAPIDAATRGAEGSNEGEAGMVIVEGTDASMRNAMRMRCAEMISLAGYVDRRGCVRKKTTWRTATAADTLDRLAMERDKVSKKLAGDIRNG